MFSFLEWFWQRTLPVKITFTGPVGVFDHVNEVTVRDPSLLRYWNGRKERGLQLCYYLEDELGQLGIRGGDLRLIYNSARNELNAVTTFAAPTPLSSKHLEDLKQFTKTFWLDGGADNICGQLQVRQNVSFDFLPSGREDEIRVEQSRT